MDRADERADRAAARTDALDWELRLAIRAGRRALLEMSRGQRDLTARLDAAIHVLERRLGGNGASPA